MTHEIRNTHEAKDDEPQVPPGNGFTVTANEHGMVTFKPGVPAMFHGDTPEGLKVTISEISEAADHFLPPRAVADLIEHALPDLRRARDRIQYVPHNRQLARLVAELETTMMMLRTERHY